MTLATNEFQAIAEILEAPVSRGARIRAARDTTSGSSEQEGAAEPDVRRA